jgi:hypothetical protein
VLLAVLCASCDYLGAMGDSSSTSPMSFFFFIGNKSFIDLKKTLPSAQNMHSKERKDYKKETNINQQ